MSMFASSRRRGFIALAFLFASGTAAASGMPSAAAGTTQCKAVDEAEIAALFDGWNASLRSGDPERVADRYGEDSLLLPTLSDTPRDDREGRLDYFTHFLADRPQGRIDRRWIRIGCNSAVDAGLYTFHFARTGQEAKGRYSFSYEWNGDRWLITSHHSSLLPED